MPECRRKGERNEEGRGEHTGTGEVQRVVENPSLPLQRREDISMADWMGLQDTNTPVSIIRTILPQSIVNYHKVVPH